MIVLTITARATYAKVKPVIAALIARQAPLTLLVAGSALLEHYGCVVDTITADFPTVPIHRLMTTYEGTTLETSAKETGALLIEATTFLARLGPLTRVVVTADRHEVLAVAQAAAYLHLSLIHLQGGERSGSIDDRVRDAITMFADIHCVATSRAALRVCEIRPSTQVLITGCPSIDTAHAAQKQPPVSDEELGELARREFFINRPVNLRIGEPFLVVLQHPVTTEILAASHQLSQTLEACRRVGLPLVVFWPQEEAGAELSSKQLRQWCLAHTLIIPIATVRSLPPERFLRLLSQARCLIGNSSAGIRECSALGVPVVNIGTRQLHREVAGNVLTTSYETVDIQRAIHRQLAHGPYPSSALYGDGYAAERIAEVLWPVSH